MPRRKGQKRKPAEDEDHEVIFNHKKLKLISDIPEAPPEIPEVSETKEVPQVVLPRRSPNGYLLPEPLPQGLVITDLKKKKWRLGKSIGLGGFGEIYSAALLNGNKASNEDYVVKVEPHTNGPLFVELHFYCKAANLETINNFMVEKKMTHLGIPDLKGLGSFQFHDKKLRFIVMPRYGKDLQDILDHSKSSHFTADAASAIATQVVDCYEYLHSQGYVHKDLKGANLLFDRSNDKNRVYLVDYGLTSRYIHQGLHKPFEPDQRSAHEGTLEYTSRDAHLGCVSRRGDIEVLLYVLIDWLGGKLSWDVEETLKPTQIQEMKIEAFYDVKGFLTKAFENKNYPAFLEDLMNVVKQMRFEEAPDYNYLRSLFQPYKKALQRCTTRSSIGKKVLEQNNNETTEDEDEEISFINKPRMRKLSKRRSLPMNVKRQNSTSQPWTPSQMEAYNEQKNGVIRTMCEESLINPTPAMMEQMARMQKRSKGCPNVSGITRRKGMVNKRRLDRQGVVDAEHHRKIGKDLLTLFSPPAANNKRGTPRAPIRKSPRRIDKKKLLGPSIGQHLFGIVAPLSNLVKSMFQLNLPPEDK